MAGPRLMSTAEGTTSHAFGKSEWLMLCSISTIWGASFLFIANALESFKPLSIGFIRVTLGATTLVLLPQARRAKIDRHDWVRIACLGLVWMAIPLTLFPIAEQWVSSSVAGMLNGGMPIVVVILSSLLLRRAPGPRQLVGVAIGFVGIVLIGWPSLRGSRAGAHGVLLIVLALVCYAVSNIIAVPLTHKYGAIPTQMRVQVVGAMLTAPMGLYNLRYAHPHVKAIASLLPLGILGTGLAFVLVGRFVAKVGATRGTIFTYLMPIVSIGLGVVFRNDQVAILSLCGCAVVLVGAFVTSRAGR